MLTVTDVSVRYGDLLAVDRVSLEVGDGEVVAVLGPSGCGKSTLLRAVGGLEPVTTGTVHVAGRDVTTAPPETRDVGLTFQDGALFPHRTVAENLAFGPRMRSWDRATTQARVEEVLELVDLTGYGDRPVTALSGGEAQRVALARALAPRPRLLMLDEPLGALDRGLHDRLLADLPAVFAEAGATVVYVTHDQDEALTLADRVAVMRAGRFAQVGTPDDLWRHPVDPGVARFLGLDQLLPGTVAHGGVDTALGHLSVDAAGRAEGAEVTVLVLPDAVELVDDRGGATPGRIRVQATVTARRFAGDHLVLELRSRAGGVVVRVPVRGIDAPEVGAAVTVAVDPAAVRLLPPGRGQ